MTSGLSLHTFERFLWLLTKIIVPPLLFLAFIRFFVFSVAVVDGPSMQPTFTDGTILGVNRITTLFTDLKRGDLVQGIDPRSNHLVLKRVIGLPGETIHIKQGKVFLGEKNGQEHELDESSYLSKDKITRPVGDRLGAQTIVAGKDEYIVLGDNRTNSGDSRHYGPLHRSKIIGKIFRIL
jgi:signal peptidase I